MLKWGILATMVSLGLTACADSGASDPRCEGAECDGVGGTGPGEDLGEQVTCDLVEEPNGPPTEENYSDPDPSTTYVYREIAMIEMAPGELVTVSTCGAFNFFPDEGYVSSDCEQFEFVGDGRPVGFSCLDIFPALDTVQGYDAIYVARR